QEDAGGYRRAEVGLALALVEQGAGAVERGGAAIHQVEHRAERRLFPAVACGGGCEIEQAVVLAVHHRDARPRRGPKGCELHRLLPCCCRDAILRHRPAPAKSFVAIITIGGGDDSLVRIWPARGRVSFRVTSWETPPCAGTSERCTISSRRRATRKFAPARCNSSASSPASRGRPRPTRRRSTAPSRTLRMRRIISSTIWSATRRRATAPSKPPRPRPARRNASAPPARDNFSGLPAEKRRPPRHVIESAGAGEGNRTLVVSLEIPNSFMFWTIVRRSNRRSGRA